MRFTYALAMVAFFAACGDKAPPTPTAGTEEAAPAPAGGGAITAQMPDTAEARAFAQRLVDVVVEDFTVSSSGARFVYRTLDFQPDGTWAATGAVTAGDETMDCRESGTWAIESAESEQSAFMQWNVVETNCAARDAGTTQRVEMTFDAGGAYTIAFR